MTTIMANTDTNIQPLSSLRAPPSKHTLEGCYQIASQWRIDLETSWETDGVSFPPRPSPPFNPKGHGLTVIKRKRPRLIPKTVSFSKNIAKVFEFSSTDEEVRTDGSSDEADGSATPRF
jgi:hypothetical protein